jgi:hypothetical protein
MRGPASLWLQAVLPLVAAVPAAVFAQAPLGEADMAKANKAAARVVNERMASERPDDFAMLKKVDGAEIIVVSGVYDRVEDVLRAVGIRHVVVTPAQLDSLELNARQLLIIDCPGNISGAAVEKVRKFVNAGGFLYTTDWALKNVVERAFPGYVQFNGHPTTNDVVAVQVKKKDNVFLKQLQLAAEDPKWWLESSSYPIRVQNREKVDVLITSREMAGKYGEPAIAITFPYGDGRVLHIASHFYLQQNQRRSVADNAPAAGFLMKEAALPAPVKAKVAADPQMQGIKAGDLESAYAASQLSTNLVVERKKDQSRVDGLYDQKLSKPSPTAPAAAAQPVGNMAAGTKVRVLEKKGEQVKVRTMSGDESWVDANAL